MEVEKNTYYCVGVMLAISIVCGGPALSFFSGAVTDFLLRGLGKTRPTVSHMSMFANNALLGGGVRVRVWIREQRKTKRRSKALLCL